MASAFRRLEMRLHQDGADGFRHCDIRRLVDCHIQCLSAGINIDDELHRAIYVRSGLKVDYLADYGCQPVGGIRRLVPRPEAGVVLEHNLPLGGSELFIALIEARLAGSNTFSGPQPYCT